MKLGLFGIHLGWLCDGRLIAEAAAAAERTGADSLWTDEHVVLPDPHEPPSPEPPSPAIVRATARAGVDRLVFYPLVDSVPMLTAWLEEARRAILSVDDEKGGMR